MKAYSFQPVQTSCEFSSAYFLVRLYLMVWNKCSNNNKCQAGMAINERIEILIEMQWPVRPLASLARLIHDFILNYK